MSSLVPAGILGVFGGLLLLGSLFGAYNYARLSRMPSTHPSKVRAGDAVAMGLTVDDSSPTVEAPFSQTPAAIVYWQIERYASDTDGSNWKIVADGIEHPDVLRTHRDSYDVTVELPADMGGRDIPEASGNTTVATGEDPPDHVRQFERDRELENTASILGGKQKRRYGETRFEIGDTLTVYGQIEPTAGEFVSGDRFELTPNGSKFMITRGEPAKTKRKRALGSLVAFVLGVTFLGAAIAVL